MDEINIRLEKFLQSESMTAYKFAEIMEISPSNITHILKGRNNPNFEFVSRFLTNFPEINPDWLINGSGDMYRNGQQHNSHQQDIQPSLFPEETDNPGNSPESYEELFQVLNSEPVLPVQDTVAVTNQLEKTPTPAEELPTSESAINPKQPDTSDVKPAEDPIQPVIKQPETSDVKPAEDSVQPEVDPQKESVKQPKLIKIVMFYDDMTFVEYNCK